MNKNDIRERYERFKEWQEHPHTYKLTSDEIHHCNNCGHEFTGNFCPICSQKAGMGRIGWSSVHQGIMDIWGLGTRSLLYSVWQLLLRPGHIISDYIDGKRQVSFPPVKMLFIIAVIYSMIWRLSYPKRRYTLTVYLSLITADLKIWRCRRYRKCLPRDSMYTMTSRKSL